MSEAQPVSTTPEAPASGPENVDSAAPEAKSSGDNMTSFDDLEAVSQFKSKEIEQKAKEKADIDLKAKEIKKGETDGKKKAKTETKTEAKAEDDEVLEAQEEVKVYKVKNGEADVEIQGDSVHKVKIDGKEEDVPYQELVNSYAGQQAVKRRFDQFSKERQTYLKEREQFVRERDEVVTTVNDITQMLKENPIQGMTMIAEMSGLDGLEFQKQFMEKLVPAVEDYMGLSETEKSSRQEAMRTDQEKLKLERERKKFDRDKGKTELAREVDVLKRTHDIDDVTFNETFIELEALQKAGKFEGQITAKLVAETVIDDRIEQKVTGVLEVVKPKLLEDESVIDDIIDVLRDVDPNNEFGDDDIKEIIQRSYQFTEDETSETKLSKKVKSSKKTKGSSAPLDPGREMVSFDELEF
ncbi:MAG: hypothetical protein ACYSR9_13610 [Planctomycetota bacterium]|jgi:hypothetical protein